MTSPGDFLSLVWGADDQGGLSGVHFIAEKTPGGFIRHAVANAADASAKADEISKRGHDAYFACAAFKTGANRTADNALGAQSLWLDVDCGADKAAKDEGYSTKEDAVVAVGGFCKSTELPRPPGIVDSGNGLHFYWPFEDFISAHQWRKFAGKLKKLAAKHGLRADPARTADIASILRVPGTMNFKDPSNPKPVAIWHSGDAIDFQAFAAALDQHDAPDLGSNTGPQQRDGDFPPSSAVEMIKHCPTLAHVARVRGAVNEPLWRNMLGVVKFTTEGDPLCHEWSKGDPRYDANETQKKIVKWTSGPTLCDTFRATSGAKCQGCKQMCKSPIQLGWSEDIKPVDAALHEMNLRYFIARLGGGVYVFDEQDKAILPNGMSFNSFRQFKAGWMIDGKSVANTWLNSPLRRIYDALVFDPSGKCATKSYNLWRGLAVCPAKGKCKLITAHIFKVWCGRNRAQFKYVMRWLALLVQKPWMKPEVAIVLRSKEGTGKTIIVKFLLDFFGVHGFTTAQRDQVAGRFNGHLFDKVLVVLEEAFFAGDPAAVAAAKALVTNTTLGYEAKGKDPFSALNYAHVISLTNNDWAIPAGADTRRWMMLDVSDERRGDHPYFKALAEEIENGGAEAFLHRLLNIDLTGYNPRALPQSNALHAQQVETLTRKDAAASWWLCLLSEGCIPGGGCSTDWDAEIPAVVLQDSYTDFTARFRGAPIWDVAAKRLRKLLPSSGLQKIRKGPQTSRVFVYKLPDLGQARRDFTAVTGIDPCAI